MNKILLKLSICILLPAIAHAEYVGDKIKSVVKLIESCKFAPATVAGGDVAAFFVDSNCKTEGSLLIASLKCEAPVLGEVVFENVACNQKFFYQKNALGCLNDASLLHANSERGDSNTVISSLSVRYIPNGVLTYKNKRVNPSAVNK